MAYKPQVITNSENQIVDFFDDFMYGGNALLTAGSLGSWFIQPTGTVAGVTPQSTGLTNRPGILTLTTGTDTTGSCIISQFNTVSGVGTFRMTDGEYTATFYIRTGGLSDGTDTYILTFGVGDTTATGGTGAYIQYTHSVNSGSYTCTCSNGGTATTSNSAVAFSANAYRVFQIVINAAGTSVSFLSGATTAALATLVTAIATNVPTGQVAPFVRVTKSAGTAARTCIVDLITIKEVLNTVR